MGTTGRTPLGTIEDLNGLEVSRKAMEMLRLAGQAADGETLYLAQLALWAVEKAGEGVETDVADTVRAMAGWRPARVVNFFGCEGDDAGCGLEGWREAGTPLQLARIILLEIDRRVYQHFPIYLSGD